MMDRLYHVICLFNLLLVIVMLTNGKIIYIAPQPDEIVCPQYPCTSLSQFATDSSSYISNGSNTTLCLLPGHHRLDDEIMVSNADSFIIMNYLRDEGAVLIECNNSVGKLSITLIKFVYIKGWLHFLGCGGNKISMVAELMIEEVSFEGVVGSLTALELSEISFAVVARSNFNASSYDSHYLATQFDEDPGDSDHIVLDGFRSTPTGGAITITFTNIWIESCVFDRNIAQFSATAAIFADKTSNISILESRFLNNEASNFSSVLFLGLNSILHVSNCMFKDNIVGTAVIISVSGDISINGSMFSHNRGMLSGSAIFAYGSSVHITASIFSNNSVMHNGGVLYAYGSSIYAAHSSFTDNLAQFYGGVLYTHNSSFTFINSTFSSNTVQADGGVMYIDNAVPLHTIIINCTFSRNIAQYFGGVVRTNITQATIFITGSTFSDNFANTGGVIATEESFHIVHSTFSNNMALISGGVTASYGSFYFTDCVFSKNVAQFILGGTFAASNGSYYIDHCSFEGNRAGALGGAIVANNGSFLILNSKFHDNIAPVNGGDMLVSQCLFLIANCTFSNSSLSLYFFNSNITFDGYVSFKNDEFVTHKISHMLEESDNQGGAITSFHSHLYFLGQITLESNLATDGAAILATSSMLWVDGTMLLAYNTAVNNGGAIYLEGATLEIFRSCKVSQNRARRGGGILASASTITVYQQGTLTLHDNTADEGGSLYLEANAKLYLSKSVPELSTFDSMIHTMVLFAGNHAIYGGAVYVADSNNCKNAQECPLQTVISEPWYVENGNLINMIFSKNNSAAVAGSNLYGMLLDRCIPNPFAEVHHQWFQRIQPSYTNGVDYLKTISNITIESISSPPVKVCFCNSDGQPDCDYRLPTIQIKKGETFTVPVVAIDNVDHPLSANIISSLSLTNGGFEEGQQTQTVKNNCTDLTFNVFSPHNSETITLAADGPCGSSSFSVRQVYVEFTNCTCPIGFEPSNRRQTRCECICHSLLFPYIVQCNFTTNTIVRINTNSWISYINDTDHSGYVVHPHCPFDHCFPQTVAINIDLSAINGADAQCQYNRSGILCGSCQEDFTLSLGSSRCLACHGNWPLVSIVILFISVLAGIILVIMLLVLNLTVADGLINSFIFYANIVAASGAVLFPSSEPSFPTVFIAWLNLDIGFDVCFFPGLDAYSKTWLRLAFPVYIISLVCIIIIISRHNSIFARQIGRRDPVATLATLVLLSYTKLLSTTIAILSFADLQYPDGSRVRVWLPDGNVHYFKGRHALLAVVVGLVILIGVPYTTLLFSWQWLVQMPNWTIFKWTRDTRLNGFISTHHAPYNSKYRYWPGLLLLVRVTPYITSAVTLSSDPQIPLLITIILVGGIFFLKSIKGIRVYKKVYPELIETVMYLNLLYYAAFTLYNFKNDITKQTSIAYTSTTITFILFIGVIVHRAIKLIKHQNSQRKLNAKRPPMAGIVNQVYVNSGNTEHEEVTFSVMGISDSLSNSPEPALYELTQAQNSTECSANDSNDASEQQDTINNITN